jgi:recombination protein RecA
MSCKTHAYLKIGHSIKQKDYVDWKYSFLSSFVSTKPSSYKGNGTRMGYRFWTRSLPVFTEYYREFYVQKLKTIPNCLSLTPLSLAVWYMDDGSQNRKSLYFNTQQFTYEEQLRLLNILKLQFGLKGSLNRDKQYFRIRLFQESAQRCKTLIKPFIPACMVYKLPL